jgi:hypothetical protein
VTLPRADFAFPDDALMGVAHAFDAVLAIPALLRQECQHLVTLIGWTPVTAPRDSDEVTDPKLMGGSHARPDGVIHVGARHAQPVSQQESGTRAFTSPVFSYQP